MSQYRQLLGSNEQCENAIELSPDASGLHGPLWLIHNNVSLKRVSFSCEGHSLSYSKPLEIHNSL
jgi:hypothetical protein